MKMTLKLKTWLATLAVGFTALMAQAGTVAYIHGDVAENGNIPSGSAPAFHPMLLNDTGNRGMSEYAAMVRGEGHTIQQFYDRNTTLNAAFLNRFDAIVFGLHQKVWSNGERNALNTWIESGGGILMYSDSAAGGSFRRVGIANQTGQRAVNSILSRYGMQVGVDIGGGIVAYRPANVSGNPIVANGPIFEAEGVSPVAVDRNAGVQILYPFSDNFKVSGRNGLRANTLGITINNPLYAAMALRTVRSGKVMAQFDRQPMWNNGEGSSIRRRDNLEIQRRVINFLVGEGSTNPPSGSGFRAGITISLRGNNGFYVSSEDARRPMTCNRDRVGGWERFLVGNGPNGTFTFKNRNRFVSSEDGRTFINCNRDNAGPWERFTVQVNGNQISIKGSNNRYISRERPTGSMTCNRTAARSWETFTWRVEN